MLMLVSKCEPALKVSLDVFDLHFHMQWAQTACYPTQDLNCRAASDNHQNLLYSFTRNAHLSVVTLHVVLYMNLRLTLDASLPVNTFSF